MAKENKDQTKIPGATETEPSHAAATDAAEAAAEATRQALAAQKAVWEKMPLVIRVGPRSVEAMWKGQRVPWIRALTLRPGQAPRIELASGNSAAASMVSAGDPNVMTERDAAAEARKVRDQIAIEMRAIGFWCDVE